MFKIYFVNGLLFSHQPLKAFQHSPYLLWIHFTSPGSLRQTHLKKPWLSKDYLWLARSPNRTDLGLGMIPLSELGRGIGSGLVEVLGCHRGGQSAVVTMHVLLALKRPEWERGTSLPWACSAPEEQDLWEGWHSLWLCSMTLLTHLVLMLLPYSN